MNEVAEDDRGLLLGDGLFETLRVERGAPVALRAHLDRLDQGCQTLGLPSPERRRTESAIAAAIAAAGLAHDNAAVRVNWSAGGGGRGLDRPAVLTPRLWCAATPAPAGLGAARLVTVGVRRNEGSPLSRLKSLAYLDNVLARAEAQARGADEALMLNNRGVLACAAAANLFWIEAGQLFTPALACGVLSGVVRAAVLSAAAAIGLAAHEIQAWPEALDRADGVFLTNSLIGLRPVRRLDERTLPIPALIGELAQRCSEVTGRSA